MVTFLSSVEITVCLMMIFFSGVMTFMPINRLPFFEQKSGQQVTFLLLLFKKVANARLRERAINTLVACTKRVATIWWISKESYDQNLYSG